MATLDPNYGNPNPNPNGSDPRWWADTQTKGWDRVKEAMRRDWEQTKADFTGGKSGKDLDQNVGDTVGQAFGKRPIPPNDRPNPPDEGDIREAHEEANHVAEKLNEDTTRSVQTMNRALDGGRWEDAQLPMRFGYGAASHYTQEWDDSVEARLRGDWEESHPGQSWEEARELAHRGWDHARMPA